MLCHLVCIEATWIFIGATTPNMQFCTSFLVLVIPRLLGWGTGGRREGGGVGNKLIWEVRSNVTSYPQMLREWLIPILGSFSVPVLHFKRLATPSCGLLTTSQQSLRPRRMVEQFGASSFLF